MYPPWYNPDHKLRNRHFTQILGRDQTDVFLHRWHRGTVAYGALHPHPFLNIWYRALHPHPKKGINQTNNSHSYSVSLEKVYRDDIKKISYKLINYRSTVTHWYGIILI